MADFDFVSAAAAGKLDRRSGNQSFSGADADSGADLDVCAEDHRDDSGHNDNRRLDDGHAARICRSSLRFNAQDKRRALKKRLKVRGAKAGFEF